MTFLAPRQGLFAAIILISLCLHTLFFVVSEERKIKEEQRAVAEKSVALLAQELKVPLATNDRISMSVVADKYVKESQVSFVGIYDAKDQLLVPVGSDNDSGVVLRESVVSGSDALGSVVVKAADVSRAEIISKHWLFLLGALGLHAMLWLLYGYLARPTQELKEAIAKKVRMDLLDKGILYQAPQHNEDSEPASSQNPIKSFLEKAKTEQKPDQSTQAATQSAEASLHDQDYIVQMLFEDPNQLLATVSHDNKAAYFALCDQLLDKAIVHLLELPLLTGVDASVIKYYDDKGAKVALRGVSPAKTATAAVFLSKLMLMLNQVVYDKHREIKRFTWQIRTTVSDAHRADSVVDLAKKRREAPLILIDDKAQDEIKICAELVRLENPMSIQERESRALASVTKATAERLRSVRDKVLLED
ncbi:hypothetical protein AAX05_02675 [Moraxella bovoculi]|uniref:Uncharacterized protein n=1 Tax=Moraxella bovoculi TaxID=386891 RepID=A0AAC8PX03_9GAMM|nr:hypothetical protein [Moraxella bovoculi]AKG08184.1 hypothetical protein AAX06_08560 [Moraxella bovoculi]AKG09260.1 hypothetical protein AAX05_02675 [Moraxella bovoculi]AKG11094.1 hypothetical protein AAX07_02715 [Moraxella bovoculi]AKG13086.1 hypothetical protein AAX11_02430 [Moraxella bovoculi]